MAQAAVEDFPDDSHLFHTLIIRTTQQTLALVQQAGEKLSPDVQEQVKNILSYALALEQAWADACKLVALAAPIMEMKGQRQEWAAFLDKAIAECERRGDREFLAAFRYHASILYRLMGQSDCAWHHADNSVANFALCGNKRQQAIALAERAWIEHERGRDDEATESIQHSWELLQANGSHLENDPEIANYHRVLGTIALSQANCAEAEQHYRRALAGFQQHGDKRRMAWSFHNLGLALSRQKKYLESIPFYAQAARQSAELDDIYHLAHISFNQGTAHTALEQYQEASACYQVAIPIYQKMNDKFRLSRIYSDLGLAFYNLENYADAVVQFQASINLATTLQDDSWRLNAMDGLGMTLIEQAEYDTAIKILQAAIADLPLIQHSINFAYLSGSLPKHLEQAISKKNGYSSSLSECTT